MSGKSWLYFILLGIIWGSNFLWIKISVQDVPPVTSAAFRVLIGLLSIGIICIIRRIKIPFRAKFSSFFMMGIFNQGLPFILVAISQQYISSGLAAILNGTVPLFTMVIAHFFTGADRINFQKILGLAVSFSGVFVLMSERLDSGFGSHQLGQIIMLLACLSFAIGNVYSKQKAQGMTPAIQTCGQLLVATVLVTLAAEVIDSPLRIPNLPITWLALACLGMINTTIGTLLYFALINSVGATRTSLVTYLIPLVAVVLGIVFLGEKPGWFMLTGGILVIIGIIIVNSKSNLIKNIFVSQNGKST